MAPTQPHAVGIDVGSTNAKAALVGADGTLAGVASRPIPTHRDGDVAEQDPEVLWAAVVDAVAELAASAPDEAAAVRSVGVCSQYSSIVPVDATGTPTADLVLYLDQRGTPHSWAIIERHAEAFELWVERHGIPPVGGGLSLGHVLHLMHDRPEVHERTAWYLEPMDFVNLRLTGDATANQGTMFMAQVIDNRTLGVTEYDGDLVRLADLDPAKLPSLTALDGIVGPLLPGAAEAMGLPAGVPVVASMNDSHAGAFATGAFTPGRAGVAVGTTSVLLDTIDRKDLDPDHEVLSMPSPVPGTYLVWAENGLGGKALEHVLEHVVYAVDHLGDHITDDQFAQLDAALASVAPGAEGVLFLPWLSGSMSPTVDPAVRGAFLNLSLDTRRTHLVRAVVEGICHNLAWLLPVVERFSSHPVEHVAFSGGAARSAVWPQVLADVLDRPVSPLDRPEAAVARAVGQVALGRVGELDLSDLPALAHEASTFEPDPATRDRYAAAHHAFEGAFAALRPVYGTLNG